MSRVRVFSSSKSGDFHFNSRLDFQGFASCFVREAFGAIWRIHKNCAQKPHYFARPASAKPAPAKRKKERREKREERKKESFGVHPQAGESLAGLLQF